MKMDLTRMPDQTARALLAPKIHPVGPSLAQSNVAKPISSAKSGSEAPLMCLELEKATGKRFVWLCCCNDGVALINDIAIELLGIDESMQGQAFHTVTNIGEPCHFYAHPSVHVRLTRNIDKGRGYVIGAVGVVKQLPSRDDRRGRTFFS